MYLHGLLVGQDAARRLRLSARSHIMSSAFWAADGPHGVMDTAPAEAGLGDDEGLALAAEQCLPGTRTFS